MSATPGALRLARARVATARQHRERVAAPGAYTMLVGIVAVLNLIGLVMVLSASSVASLTDYGSAWYFFQRQVVWTLLGLGAFVLTARVDYRKWRAVVGPLLLATIVLLVLVLIPGIGIYVSGSRRWLGWGWLRFQPTEIAKVAMLLFVAEVVSRRQDQLDDVRRVIAPAVGMLGVFALLVLAQPDLDSTLVITLIVGSVLVVGGARLGHLALLGSMGATAVAGLAVVAPYRRARVFSFLEPWSDASNTGYQLSQSLIALGSGGWTGVGLGAGRSKWLFLPNAHTDFIFAIIGEELGLVGCLLVVALFMAFAVLGARVALRTPDPFGALLAAGVTTWVTAQAFINIGGVIGILPVSGIPLPFVSFGGSALVFTMVGAGMLASVAREVP